MVRRRWRPAAAASVLILVAGCSHPSAGARGGSTPSSAPASKGASSTSPPPTVANYGVGTAFLPLVGGAVWDYVDVGGPSGTQHLAYQIGGIRTSPGGTTASVTVTTGSGKVNITYLVDSSHNVHVQLGAGAVSESGQGNFIIPASPLSCSPCRYTGAFIGSVPGFPPFSESLTEVVTSVGPVGLFDPENHTTYPGTAHLHASIDVVPAAGGPPVTVSTTEEVYLAPGVGIVEDGDGTASVSVGGSTHSSPTGTLWLTGYVR